MHFSNQPRQFLKPAAPLQTFPSGSGSVETMLSWISPGYEIRLDVYTPAGRPQFSAQLDRLTALLETLAARKQAASLAGQ